jgi:hypothetical protein
MRVTASYASHLQGRTPVEAVMGETPDISEYLDFCCYDWVWFKRDAGIGKIELGKFLGISRSTGSLMSYHILPKTGVPVSRTTVQQVTELEKQTDANRQRFAEFEKAIAEQCKEGQLVDKGGDKPDLADWSDLLKTDPDFAEEFATTFDNPDIKEADDECDTDSSYDNYLGMELTLDRPGNDPQFACVTKRVKDNQGTPIGVANNNPILDTCLYEVEHPDGHRAAMSANITSENLLSQVDQDGHRALLFGADIARTAMSSGRRMQRSQVPETTVG